LVFLILGIEMKALSTFPARIKFKSWVILVISYCMRENSQYGVRTVPACLPGTVLTVMFQQDLMIMCVLFKTAVAFCVRCKPTTERYHQMGKQSARADSHFGTTERKDYPYRIVFLARDLARRTAKSKSACAH
jgi:hypothetical protein